MIGSMKKRTNRPWKSNKPIGTVEETFGISLEEVLKGVDQATAKRGELGWRLGILTCIGPDPDPIRRRRGYRLFICDCNPEWIWSIRLDNVRERKQVSCRCYGSKLFYDM